MKTTVLVPFEFYASYSLSIRETSHTHHWTLKLFVTGIPRNGMVIDILKLREITNPHIELLIPTLTKTKSWIKDKLNTQPAKCSVCIFSPMLHLNLRVTMLNLAELR